MEYFLFYFNKCTTV